MIKRTIEVSSAPTHLAARNRQLLLRRDDQVVASIPCEDLGVVVVDHPQASYTHAALCEMLQAQAVLVVCGPDHLPQGLLLPLSDHSQVVWRLREQLAASRPLKKRLWKQIVRAKIRAQAANLDPRSAPYRRLQALFREVRSGDSTNREAQAARVYWNAWLVNPDREPPEAEHAFRRDPDGLPPNPLLNYGYAIVRAAVARAVVAAGLLPALGLQHTQRGNPFCLADDLLEPLRPLVDARVRALYWAGQTELNRDTKAALLELLAAPVRTARERGPLMVALHRYVASLVKCYQRAQSRLEIPIRCS